MAISIIGSVTQAGATKVATTPTGAASGDDLIFFVAAYGASAVLAAGTVAFTPPAGATLVGPPQVTTFSGFSAGPTTIWVYRLTLVGTPAATYTFIVNGDAQFGGTEVATLCLRGAGAVDGFSSAGNGAGSANPSVSGFTTTVANDLLIWYYWGENQTASAGPSGFTLQLNTNTGNPTGSAEGMWTAVQAVAGASGAKAITATSDDWVAVMVAVSPAATPAFVGTRRTTRDDTQLDDPRGKAPVLLQFVKAWAVLAQQRRPNDEQPDVASRAAARFVVAAPSPKAQVLYLPRRGSDDLPAEERRARLASAPASVAPRAALALARRAQEDTPAIDTAPARRFVGASAAAQAAVLASPRRAADDSLNEVQRLARSAVFSPAAQALSAVLAQPKRNATEALEEDRPQRRGFVSAAVAQIASAILAPLKRNIEVIEEERPQRRGFVSSAIAQIASAVLTRPKRNAEAIEEDRPQRKGFAVAQVPNAILAQPKRNAEAIEEDRPQRRGFVSSVIAQIASAVLAQPKRNAEAIEEEARTIRRTLWSFVTALLQSLGGTVRINEQAQAVSLSAEQIQQVAAVVQTQTVTVEGVESMYYVNTRTRMTFTFSDFDGTPTDPTVVSLLIDGATVAPTRKSAGVWYYDYLPASPGPKNYVITGTGTIAATRPGVIMVLAD